MSLDATLLLHCPDTKGIVYEVSRFIFSRGGNIIDAQQHREEIDNRFFMRVHFDASEMGLPPEKLREDLRGLAAQFHMDYRLDFSHERRKVAILVSKYDHCLYDLLLRGRYGELAADVAIVVSNHGDLENVARHFEVPFVHVPVEPSDKALAEARILALMVENEIELIVLARYMQILSPELCAKLEGRIINIHHSFLPSFKGAAPYQQAYKRGVKLIGATAHYVTAALDEGPIIEQEVERVDHTMTAEDLTAIGRDIENVVLSRAVAYHVERRVLLNGHKTVVFK